MLEDQTRMSKRTSEPVTKMQSLRADIEEARAITTQQHQAEQTPQDVLYAPELSTLTPDELQVVSLGVSPDAWRPISMLNNAHYTNLLQTNSISGSLAAKLESYKAVSGA